MIYRVYGRNLVRLRGARVGADAGSSARSAIFGCHYKEVNVIAYSEVVLGVSGGERDGVGTPLLWRPSHSPSFHRSSPEQAKRRCIKLGQGSTQR